jgi:hypothetical protein
MLKAEKLCFGFGNTQMSQEDRRPKGAKGGPPCQRTAHEILGYFVSRLREEAIATQAPLPLDRIEQIASAMESETTFSHLYQRCFSDYSSKKVDEKRKDVIGRLIVHRFAYQLSSENNPEPGSQEMSRWIIPVFLSLIKMMIGEVMYDRYNGLAKTVQSNLRQHNHRCTDWAELFAYKEANDLVDDLLVEIASAGKPFEQRTERFVNTINTKLNQHKLGPNDHAERGRWTFKGYHLARISAALYQPLTKKVANTDQRLELVNRHHDKIKDLADLLKILDFGLV